MWLKHYTGYAWLTAKISLFWLLLASSSIPTRDVTIQGGEDVLSEWTKEWGWSQ